MSAAQLQYWVEHGYVILPGAVDPKACDALRIMTDQAWRNGDPRLRIKARGRECQPLQRGAPIDHAVLLDIYRYPEALPVLLSESITTFLRLIFTDTPLLFQSLSFTKGSEQGMHQDTAYVVVDSPLELAAAWIALEDIREGSGELMYYDGSHRAPEFLFSGRYKHYSPARDGEDQHNQWAANIHQSAARLGFPKRTFLPKKGDALIWSADLAHGGSPITDPTLTRKSIVAHYCPNRVSPTYLCDPNYARHHLKKAHDGRAFYASAHYVLEPKP